MNPINCPSCGQLCCYAADTDGDLVNLNVVCICGYNNIVSFIGYPKLWGTDDTYFEFTDEFKIECKHR